jgi:hypothetical protein
LPADPQPANPLIMACCGWLGGVCLPRGLVHSVPGSLLQAHCRYWVAAGKGCGGPSINQASKCRCNRRNRPVAERQSALGHVVLRSRPLTPTRLLMSCLSCLCLLGLAAHCAPLERGVSIDLIVVFETSSHLVPRNGQWRRSSPPRAGAWPTTPPVANNAELTSLFCAVSIHSL